MTSTELLGLLEQTGTPPHTIEEGKKFVRLMQTENPHEMLQHFRNLRITEGTIHKAMGLLGGKSVKDYVDEPPARVQENSHLARMFAQETKRLVEQIMEQQATKQAEAMAAGIGNPKGHREVLATAKK